MAPFIDAQLRLIGIDDADLAVVRDHAAKLTARLGEITDRYYAHLAGTEWRDLVAGAAGARARPLRIAHWRRLIEGDFTGVATDWQAPREHPEAGLPRSVGPSATRWFLTELFRWAATSPEVADDRRVDLAAGLVRLACLDLALAQASADAIWLD